MAASQSDWGVQSVDTKTAVKEPEKHAPDSVSFAMDEVINAMDAGDSDSGAFKDGEGGDASLKRTPGGTLLVPQPTDDPDEPLNWSWTRKHLALFVLALGSFYVKFTATVLAPGAVTLAHQFHVTNRQGTYVTSAASLMPAVAPFVWIPLSRKFGRRPVLLAGTVMAIVFAIAVARAQTYAGAVACRICMAAGASAAICIGPAAISDMFFLHEKGTRMGMNTFLLVCAPYLGGVAGGSIQQDPRLGWRWAMYMSAILLGGLLVAQFLFVPETIFDRSRAVPASQKPPKTLFQRLGLGFERPTVYANETWKYTFTRTFSMAAYPAVVLPSLWFSVAAMTEVANTAGFALNFGPESRWHFNSRGVGFCSFSGLIGAVVGEMFAGPLCDFVAKRHLKKGTTWRPEKLLPLSIPGLVTISAGLLLYGFELNYPTSWAAALTGIGIFTAGQEIMLTVLMTYMTDCYPGTAAEISVVFQCFLNLMAYHPGFYTPQWIDQPGGAKVPYIVFAVLPIVFFPPCAGLLMWKGPQIRARGPWFTIGS
ncbi:hypothetical protein VTK73DRAFT_9599 [Phialemonium thermophilum]|uniref:Major facilitator superfamily (MFS) profile domain-containing protein n=1 Tax=Phialemonium thermophilum TaxID=223376 RepID=A0ABR3W1P4_9PEZI